MSGRKTMVPADFDMDEFVMFIEGDRAPGLVRRIDELKAELIAMKKAHAEEVKAAEARGAGTMRERVAILETALETITGVKCSSKPICAPVEEIRTFAINALSQEKSDTAAYEQSIRESCAIAACPVDDAESCDVCRMSGNCSSEDAVRAIRNLINGE